MIDDKFIEMAKQQLAGSLFVSTLSLSLPIGEVMSDNLNHAPYCEINNAEYVKVHHKRDALCSCDWVPAADTGDYSLPSNPCTFCDRLSCDGSCDDEGA